MDQIVQNFVVEYFYASLCVNYYYVHRLTFSASNKGVNAGQVLCLHFPSLSVRDSDRFRFFDIVTNLECMEKKVSVANMLNKCLLAFLLFDFTFSKHFEICELASIFKDYFPPQQINDCKFFFFFRLCGFLKDGQYLLLGLLQGLCLVEGESQYNSSAVGTLNSDGSQDLGLFQLSEKWWCKWDRVSILGCRVKCDKLLDDDITDDIKCVKKVFKEHKKLSGNGFNAWVAWKTKCQDRDLSSFNRRCQNQEKWLLDPDFQPGIVAPLPQET